MTASQSVGVSSLPEWSLAPVRRVEPAAGLRFPLLVQAPEDADPPQWARAQRERLDDQLAVGGAVLLRGLGIHDEKSFENTVRELCGALESGYGDLVRRASADFVYDATRYPNDRAILFHNEGSHTPRLPTRQFFVCLKASRSGGETPIADCRRIVDALEPDLLAKFVKKGLRYTRNFIPGVDVSWQRFFQTDDRSRAEAACKEQGIHCSWRKDGGLKTTRQAPAVIRHPAIGAPSFCNQLLLHHVACLDAKTSAALRTLLKPEDMPRHVSFGDGSPIADREVAEVLKAHVDSAVRFTWQPGDILMLDNLVVAHARCAFEGERQILVAIGDLVAQASLNTAG